MLNSGQNWRFFCFVWPGNLTDDLENQLDTSFILCQALCIISKPSVNLNWSKRPETLNSGQNRRLFGPRDLEIWRMTLKKDTAPLLYYIKHCTSFQSHWWIQIGVIVRNQPIRVKIVDCLCTVTLEFDGWHCKTIGHLFYATSSCVHHFITISEFKLGLQSGNAQFRSKWTFFSRVTLKFCR